MYCYIKKITNNIINDNDVLNNLNGALKNCKVLEFSKVFKETLRYFIKLIVISIFTLVPFKKK